MLSTVQRGLSTTSTVAAVVGLQCFLGVVIATNSPLMGVGVGVACGLLVLSLKLQTPLAVVALPAVFFTTRLSFGGADLSYADAAVVIGALFSVRLIPFDSPPLKKMAGVFATYLAIVAFAVMLNPTSTVLFEWAHRAAMLFGSLIVGAAVAYKGGTRLALRLIVLVLSAAGFDAVRQALSSGFEPAWPLGTHKNHGGAMLAAGVVILVVARKELALRLPVRVIAQVLMLGGILACQSRGAAGSLILMMFVNLLRRGIKNSVLVLVGMAALGVMIWSTTAEVRQDTNSADRSNSYESRLDTYSTAMEYWRESPLGGAGFRYWEGLGTTSEPHNFAVSALAESGVIGLTALLVLVAASLVVLFRTRGTLAWCGFLLVLGHLADSAVGIFWVAGTGTLPWLVVGLACGDVAAGVVPRRAVADPPVLAARTPALRH